MILIMGPPKMVLLLSGTPPNDNEKQEVGESLEAFEGLSFDPHITLNFEP